MLGCISSIFLSLMYRIAYWNVTWNFLAIFLTIVGPRDLQQVFRLWKRTGFEYRLCNLPYSIWIVSEMLMAFPGDF